MTVLEMSLFTHDPGSRDAFDGMTATVGTLTGRAAVPSRPGDDLVAARADTSGLREGRVGLAEKKAEQPPLHWVAVPGASEEARRVKIMNANWAAGADGEDGHFELMIVTTDDRQHFVAPSPAAMRAVIALAQADTVLVWDPADRRLIAANLRGTMPWTEREEDAPETG